MYIYLLIVLKTTGLTCDSEWIDMDITRLPSGQARLAGKFTSKSSMGFPFAMFDLRCMVDTDIICEMCFFSPLPCVLAS